MNNLSFCQITPLILALYRREYSADGFYAPHSDFGLDKMIGNNSEQLTCRRERRHERDVFSCPVFQTVKIEAD